MMRYLDALQILKSSFLDGSENSIISDYIVQYFPKKKLDILDIGIGDGQNAWKLTNTVQRAGFIPTVTGVDPLSDSERIIRMVHPSFRFVRSEFETYETREEFDVVIAAQSLYYIRDVRKTIEKMMRLTRKGGLSVIVLWSKECAINRIYRPCNECGKFYCNLEPVTAESAFDYIQTMRNIQNAQLMYFSGRVFFSLWKSVPAAIPGACTILSRSGSHEMLSDHSAHVRKLLRHFNDVESRVNGVIFIQK